MPPTAPIRRAFTLVELLVVVSIIALLLAILLPVLSNVKYSVRTTQCASRLKQIGIAVTAYATDNNEYYPHKVEPGAGFFNPLDGEYYREDRKPWAIRSNTNNLKFDYIPLIEPYVSDISEIFVCPHIDYDWGGNDYRANGATMIPYAMYWGIVRRPNSGGAVREPMVRLGEGFGPGTLLDGGGISQDSEYRILASDYVRLGTSHGVNQYPDGTPFSTSKGMANHPPTSGDYFFAPSNNANGAGYVYDTSINGNANYLYDDGSVELEGQIRQETVGNNAEHDFRNAGAWLAPTHRVEN